MKGPQEDTGYNSVGFGHHFTFLGEKVLGIFAGHYEFARDTPQQLNDQCYMVYMGAGGTRHTTELSDRVPSRAHSESVDGGWRVEG